MGCSISILKRRCSIDCTAAMSGGSNCAVVGCYTRRAKCRGLSFHKLPKKGKNDVWRNDLIALIDRVDSSFNPDTATICSRHFKESCFVPTNNSHSTPDKDGYFKRKPHYLKPGSLPTEYMPQKSIVTHKPVPRKVPLPRDPPPLPSCVKYMHFSELKKDVCNPQCLPSPWCLLEVSDNRIIVGMMNEKKTSVKLKLKISEDFKVSASMMENPIPNFNEIIENVSVFKYLKSFSERKFCPGILDKNLQMYADSQYSDNQIYYKEFYIGSQETVVRSTKCEVLVKQTSTDFICKNCNYAKRLLNNKLLRAKSRESKPLSKQDPLHKATREKIISELKNSRMETNDCQQQLKQFKSTLMTDSVEIS